MTHTFTTRVYLEDVDAGGIVYHANYLKYAERARTELIAASGIRHAEVMAGGAAIIVKSLFIDYLAPLRLEQEVHVETRLVELRAASAELEQLIHSPSGQCARLQVELVYTVSGKPARWPEALKKALE
jgi:acyl-CoA thioester hydrolase